PATSTIPGAPPCTGPRAGSAVNRHARVRLSPGSPRAARGGPRRSRPLRPPAPTAVVGAGALRGRLRPIDEVRELAILREVARHTDRGERERGARLQRLEVDRAQLAEHQPARVSRIHVEL